MEQLRDPAEISAVLLSFYECLTDPGRLDMLMEMITSWLDDEDVQIVGPKLDYHADQACKLLGEISEPYCQDTAARDALEVTQFENTKSVLDYFDAQLRVEESERLKEWLETDQQTTSLLLRLLDNDVTELVILSRDKTDSTFQCKRTGPQFQNIISKFVADSFELTHAEFTLVQELLLGGTLREIADRLGKSWETTRSQVKSLTNKLGVSSQADILRMVNQAASLMPTDAAQGATQANTALRRISRPDGRTLAYEIDGPPSDKTLVWVHGMTQGRHWPDKARDYAKSRGWRLVRISRAARGQSSVNPKQDEALLHDHADDIMAIMNHEGIETFSVFAAADGFAVGYQVALQNPERVQMIVGLEVVPPILSRKVVDGFTGKMKTYGLACLYAPKTIKFMFGLAMHRLARLEDRYNVVHPLLGVELAKVEDADGIRADDHNFKDLMLHRAEGMWRDASFSCHDWAYAPVNANIRPRAALIHSGNSMIKPDGQLAEFAQRIGATIHRIESYHPYISSALPTVLNALEPI